jgi:signal transduction histidine kinase
MTSSDKQSKKKKFKARKFRALFCRGEKSRGIGIQWRLMGYLGGFVLFILIILWLFQIMLLVPFYEDIKNRELQQTADVLCAVLSNREMLDEQELTTLKDAVWDCAETYSMCITVWRVESGRARFLTEADVSEDCIIHKVSGGRQFARLYRYAVENGGSYGCKVKFHSGGMTWMDNHGNEYTEEPWAGSDAATGEQDSAPPAGNESLVPNNEDISALYMRLVQGADNKEYIILLDSELMPVSATVSTLKVQFFWIAALLLLGALLLAYLISRRVSRPLVRMNETARMLAEGNYDVHFTGRGYLETRELAETLNFAAGELSKTDRLQKELIANISHDLRTPLTMITGYSEVIRDLPGENTPENVQVIIDEANRLSELVNDLLDLSRLQSGMRTLAPEVFDLTETVRSVMHRYDKLTHRDGYHITFAADHNVAVNADRTMILQVVYNLINNAINYCGEDKTVEVVQQLEENDHVRLCVRDHGAGIAADELPHIWDRYYKIDRVHRRAMIGTGLGLSIVKGALEMHDAAYGVSSTVGEGSEFWFSLPVVPWQDAIDESIV